MKHFPLGNPFAIIFCYLKLLGRNPISFEILLGLLPHTLTVFLFIHRFFFFSFLFFYIYFNFFIIKALTKMERSSFRHVECLLIHAKSSLSGKF